MAPIRLTLKFTDTGRLWRPYYENKIDLKDKGQMSKHNEYTDTFKLNLACIFFSVRAKLKKTILPSDTVYYFIMIYNQKLYIY